MLLFDSTVRHRDLRSFPTRRSSDLVEQPVKLQTGKLRPPVVIIPIDTWNRVTERDSRCQWERSEEHTSELQSRGHLVCRLLLEKKKAARRRQHAATRRRRGS